MSTARPTLWCPKIPGLKKTLTRSPSLFIASLAKRSRTLLSSSASSNLTNAFSGGDSTQKFVPDRTGTLKSESRVSCVHRGGSIRVHWSVLSRPGNSIRQLARITSPYEALYQKRPMSLAPTYATGFVGIDVLAPARSLGTPRTTNSSVEFSSSLIFTG